MKNPARVALITLALGLNLTACGGASYAPTNSVAYGPATMTSSSSGSGGSVASGDAVSRASVAVRAPMRESAPVRGDAPSNAMPVAAASGSTTITIGVTTTTPPPAGIVAPSMVRDESEYQQPAAMLTAASVGDVDRFDNFVEYLARHPDESAELHLDPSRRVRMRVVDGQGHPVNNARITVGGESGSITALTHADGTWDFFPGVSMPQEQGPLMARVEYGQAGASARIELPNHGDAQPVVFQLQGAQAESPRTLDLGFAIDVTGSMGDELRYVNAEIAGIVQRVQARAPGVRVRVGATFYRDRVDSVPLQMIPFTDNVQGFARAMQGIEASGGGDYPEDMNAGLQAALTRMAWSNGADADRVLVVIADAPPQQYRDEQFTYREAMGTAAQRGVRILPVAASGADRTVEYLFRAMGAFTSTPYTYLTDDSGIGAPHMEADTDRVAVEGFNDLLVRLVLSDLDGRGMHEPTPLGPQG